MSNIKLMEAIDSINVKVDASLANLTIPSACHQNKMTGLVHGSLTREGLLSPRFSYMIESDTEEVMLHLFAKFSPTKNSYLIFASKDHGDDPLAYVKKTHVDSKMIQYVLELIPQVEILCINYRVPSIVSVFRDKPPRKAFVALMHMNYSSLSDKDEGKNDSQKTETIVQSCQRSFHSKGNLDLVDKSGIRVYENANPYVKSNGRVGLNFRGRGKQASSQNLQLVNSKNKLIFQMAKWEQNHYNVDFTKPFTPLQAFGFALAQLDL